MPRVHAKHDSHLKGTNDDRALEPKRKHERLRLGEFVAYRPTPRTRRSCGTHWLALQKPERPARDHDCTLYVPADCGFTGIYLLEPRFETPRRVRGARWGSPLAVATAPAGALRRDLFVLDR